MEASVPKHFVSMIIGLTEKQMLDLYRNDWGEMKKRALTPTQVLSSSLPLLSPFVKTPFLSIVTKSHTQRAQSSILSRAKKDEKFEKYPCTDKSLQA
jgi:hypothetical protein